MYLLVDGSLFGRMGCLDALEASMPARMCGILAAHDPVNPSPQSMIEGVLGSPEIGGGERGEKPTLFRTLVWFSLLLSRVQNLFGLINPDAF